MLEHPLPNTPILLLICFIIAAHNNYGHGVSPLGLRRSHGRAHAQFMASRRSASIWKLLAIRAQSGLRLCEPDSLKRVCCQSAGLLVKRWDCIGTQRLNVDPVDAPYPARVMNITKLSPISISVTSLSACASLDAQCCSTTSSAIIVAGLLAVIAGFLKEAHHSAVIVRYLRVQIRIRC